MAQLANCPQCDHDFIIPDDLVATSSARCPSCHADFKLSDAKSREVSTLEIVESAAGPGPADLGTENDLGIENKTPAQTITDFSSMETWAGEEQEDMNDDLADDDAADDAENAELHVPAELDDDLGLDIEDLDDLSIADDEKTLSFLAEKRVEGSAEESAEEGDDLELNMFADRDETVEVDAGEDTLAFHAKEIDEESAGANDEELDFAEGLAALKKEFGSAAEVEPESSELDTPVVESPEAAAQRIDAWFRSAKTLPDVPPLDDVTPLKAAALDLGDEPKTEPRIASANDATIDLGSLGVHGDDDLGLSDDFELDTPAESPQDVAAWEDSQHMERLLASIGDQPQDEFVESAEAVEATYPEEHTEAVAEWSPDAAISASRAGAPAQPKKSIVRTMAMTLVGGLMAIPLAGYTLLWLRGPDADFLGVAQYLPQAVLPSSFNKPKRAMVPPPVAPIAEETPEEKTEEPIADAPAKTDEAPAKVDEAQQATFNAPIDANKPAVDPTDRYAMPATPADKPAAEPGVFDTPPATPVKEAAPQNVAVHVEGAPTFSVAELTAALQAGKNAESGLVNGRMADGGGVPRTKGLSYSVLADLAQKSMFVDAAAPQAEVEPLQQDAAELFRTALANAHTREEVAQIVPMWIASVNRKHGGVFFAASLANSESKGTVSEFTADLGGGKSLPVLVSPALSEQLKGSSAPVAVVGWIVDKPAEKVTGYTGTAPQAIVASKLVPLQ